MARALAERTPSWVVGTLLLLAISNGHLRESFFYDSIQYSHLPLPTRTRTPASSKYQILLLFLFENE
eukprot:scaffold20011_cov33-Tisochrysis_lutea.AAC.6